MYKFSGVSGPHSINPSAGMVCGVNPIPPPPFIPIFESSIVVGSNSSVFKIGNYAYISSPSVPGKFVIVDVSNPLAPFIVTTQISALNAFTDIFIQGNYAYLPDFGSNFLEIWNIANPLAPVFVSDSFINSGPYRIFVQGTKVFVTVNGGLRFEIWDVTNPALPTLDSQNITLANPSNISISNNLIYVLDATSFQIYSIIGALISTTLVNAVNSPTNIFTLGNYCYVNAVVAGIGTLNIYDITVPALPVLKSATPHVPNSATTGLFVVAHGPKTFAFRLNSSFNTLMQYDVTNPLAPSLIFEGALTNVGPNWITVVGNYAYIVETGGGTLEIWKVF
jgi:hypothetical protein